MSKKKKKKLKKAMQDARNEADTSMVKIENEAKVRQAVSMRMQKIRDDINNLNLDMKVEMVPDSVVEKAKKEEKPRSDTTATNNQVWLMGFKFERIKR